MDNRITYQKDTTKGANPLEALPVLPNTGKLNIERSQTIPIMPLIPRDTTEQKTDTIEASSRPAPPTREQLRYWWWQREKKLLVGDSRYMLPRGEIELTSSLKTETQGFRLPVRRINRENNDWLTLLLMVVLVLLALVRTAWDKYMGNLFHSAVNYSTSSRIFQEKNTSVLQGAFWLDVLFYLVFSVFVFQLLDYFRIDLPWRKIYQYLFSLGLVLVYFSAKKMIYRLMGILVEKKSETGEFLFNMDNFNRVTGLVLFPVVTVIAFYPFSSVLLPIAIGLFVFVSLYLLLLSRGFLILLKKQFSIFYLFLYFCTLEFLPLVLLYKILVVQVSGY